MHRTLTALALTLLLTTPAAAQDPDGDTEGVPTDGLPSDFDPERAAEIMRRALVTNLHVGELRVALGGHVDLGRPGLGERGGFHLAAGFDGVTNEVLGAHLRALSFDFVWNQGAGQALFMPTLLRLDYLFFGAEGGSVCAAPFLTVWPATHCDPQSGYVGLGGSLLGYQHDTETFGGAGALTRNALRVGELYAALSFLPAFDEAFSERRFPISVGASLDYLWNLNGDPTGRTERWVGRALFAIDATYRFAGFRGGLEGRFAYRPSFTEWGNDFGIEVSLRVLYADFHTLYRRQGSLFRLVFEAGYAHWSIPGRAVGLSGGASAFGWAGIGTDSLFFRVGFEPTIWNIP